MQKGYRFGRTVELLESRDLLNATNLTALALSASEVNLTWDLTDATDTAVVVERATGASGAYQVLATLPGGENIFTDTGGWAGTTYFYRVRTLTSDGTTPYTSPTSVTTGAVATGALAAVTDLNVKATSPTTATISFTNPNAVLKASYLLERSADGVSYQTVKSLGTSTTWQDTGLTSGATYYYRVLGYSWIAPTSDYSLPAAVTLANRAAGAPAEPTELAATANSATSVTVTWTNNDDATARFKVERAVYNPWSTMTWSQVGLTTAGGTSFTDTGVTAERAYVYRVRATNAAGDSDYAAPASDVMQSIFGAGVGVVTASTGTGAARVYDIGPGRQYEDIADLDWTKLGPGDTVNIHYKEGGYHELFLISTRGTADAWITINGVADPTTGALPVIDGYQAVLAPQFKSHYAPLSGYGGLIIGNRPGFATGYKPGYITVQNLQIQNAYKGDAATNTFTDFDGTKKVYGNVGAGIYLERADHVTLKGNVIAGNGQGVFGAGQSGFDRLMTDVTLDGNHIHGNGNVGSDREHNTYLEAIDTLYQNNRYGLTRSGSLGAGLKDRSAGLVIRDNYIEGSARPLDLVEAQNQMDLAVTLPQYRQTFVYGNTLVSTPGGASSLIQYGGDSGLLPFYREGALYLYNNTLVGRSNQAQRWSIAAVKLSTTGAALDARDNILATIPDTAGATRPILYLVATSGSAYFGQNWVSPGSAVAAAGYTGHVGGTSNLLVGSSLDPGFTNLTGGDYRLGANSGAIDAGGRHAGGAASHPVDRQYRDPRSSEFRPVVGVARDLGAFEYGIDPLPASPPTSPPAPPPPAPPPPAPPPAPLPPPSPTAVGDSYQILHDRQLTVPASGVLDNDTSPAGAALAAALVSGPAHGRLVLNADGSFTYTPNAGYVGTDSFTYSAGDGAATSDPATVTLTVTDKSPVAAADVYRVGAGGVLTLGTTSGVLANDSDPDGDSLAAALVKGPTYGALTLNADGSFKYAPNAGFAGTDTFQYRASDGALSSTATVTITVDAPPQVETVRVNDGSAQRSMVTSLTVTFSEVVSLPSDPTTAFRLTGPNGTVALKASVGLDATGTKTQVVLTFFGPGIVAGSLADGRYTLTVLSNVITDSFGQRLDGDANGTAGGDKQVQFLRLFGDANGDGTVTKQEKKKFDAAVGTKSGQAGYLWYFDYDGLNGIDRSVDQAELIKRVGKRV